MRLLDAYALIYDNVARLAEFTDAANAPAYAILSHTWEDEEILFEDITLGPQHEITPHFAATSTEPLGLFRSLSISTISTVYSSTSSSSLRSDETDECELGSLSESYDGNSGAGDATSAISNASTSGRLGFRVKAGWNKVLNTCLLAIRDRLQYVWIDTCRFLFCMSDRALSDRITL